MVWWDDLWLNEAFATWMAFKIVDGWKPEWRLWLEFDTSKAAALQLDALRATHPIRAEVRNAAEAGESFDAITYEKGGAVLRMIESYLGEAPFREGIRAYMRKHAKANAVADDLWSALAESSRLPVLELANAWIRQAGFPLVHVSRAGGRSVTLTQRRFYSDPDADADEPAGAAQRWPVPMILRYRDAAGVQEHRVLFTEAAAKVELPATGEIAWLCADAGATGFFRVSYDRLGLQQLAQHLGDLAPSERVALLSDQWALVRTGKTEVAAFLDLCSAFGAEEDDAVLDELGSRLAQVGQRLVADRDRTRFQDFVSELLGAQLRVVGWDPKPGEDDAARLRRASLVRTLGLTARSQPVISEAVARLERYLAGQGNALEPNLYDAAVTMAARTGDSKRFDQFLERFRSETDPAFRRRFLFSLAAFEAAEPCLRAQELAFTDTIPLQEMSSFLGGLLGNPVARDPFWATLRARWDAVAGRLANAPMLLRRVVEAMGLLVERRQLEEVEAFLATHPMDAATQAIAQTLERLRLDVALRERSQEPISRWLDQRAKR
jgi:puromycin-sensitive aminopeptidase